MRLPELGVPGVKAKDDFAYFLARAIPGKPLRQSPLELHPLQDSVDAELICIAESIDERVTTYFGGAERGATLSNPNLNQR